MPLVLHIPTPASLDRAIEILKEENAVGVEELSEKLKKRKIILYDSIVACGFDNERISAISSLGIMSMVNGTGICENDEELKKSASLCVKKIPLNLLLCDSKSPWNTPQTLSDPYLRTLRNEPCNISAIVSVIASLFEQSIDDIALRLKNNAVDVFGLNIVSSDSTPKVLSFSLSLSFFLFLSLTRTHTHSLSNTNSHTHTLSPTLLLTPFLSLSISLYLSLSQVPSTTSSSTGLLLPSASPEKVSETHSSPKSKKKKDIVEEVGEEEEVKIT